jgi:2'-hydroxyisoflavone reductase
MKLLVLGGTVFLGRHIVQVALERGHEVTVFHRGQHGADVFPDCEHLRGDRDPNVADGLNSLKGRVWDAVVDTSGYVPRIVGASARLLSGSGRYAFISSISAYADFSQPDQDETAPLAALEDANSEDVAAHYGALKVACERVAEAAMPGRVLNIRPGLIVGAFDPTDRFTYWPTRIARGGEVLAPGTPDLMTQFIDAQDLAVWTLRLLEQGVVGTWNATGQPMRLGDLFEAILRVTRSDATLTWVSEDFLLQHEVKPWMGESSLPLWIPSSDPSMAGFTRVNITRALENALHFRGLSLTLEDTLQFVRSRDADHVWRSGLTPAREEDLLSVWHAKS